MKVFGILNLTQDSFSDGGLYFEPQQAKQKAEELLSNGANVIDVGAQSSNVDAQKITPEEEWQRLSPVLAYLKTKNIPISVDTYKPEVIAQSIQKGVAYINDITGFTKFESLEILQTYQKALPELVLMHSHNNSEIAQKESSLNPQNILTAICRFFDTRIEALLKVGVPESKIIVDPGMGFFLGDDPYLSIQILQSIAKLKERYTRTLVSVSRKSFIGNLLGGKPPMQRKVGTLVCEYYAYLQGVDYIRTHEPQPLQETILMNEILQKAVV
ncbi:MAG: dihydropteroate synthase [Spirochaetota bacterium]